MTAKEITQKHIDMVSKLAKAPDQILASLDCRKTNMLHAAIGILDEYFELEIAKHNSDKENIIEELGDMIFYTECLIMGYEKEIAYIKHCPLSRNETFQMLGRTVKRHVFYDQEVSGQKLAWTYINIKDWIKYEASQIGLTISDVQNHNMEKLAKRYPNYNYSDSLAKDRIDKK